MNNISFILENELDKYLDMFESFCPPPLTVSKGNDLLKQCETSGWMYYLIDGIAKVYVTSSLGNERIIDLMKGGTLIGMDCINPDFRSVVSIHAVTDIHVLPFNNDILRKMIHKNADFAYDLVLYYGKVLRQVTYNSGVLGITDPLIRFANFLYLFIDTGSYKNAGGVEMTQEEIAAAINISRAQVTKMCRKFRQEGIIQTGSRRITILDWDKLRSYCRF